MKDPNKFHPGCRSESCRYYNSAMLMKCDAVADVFLRKDLDSLETPHEFACVRLSCYDPLEILERFKIEYWNLGAEKRVKILDRYAGKEHTIESLIEALNNIDPNGLKL